MRPALEATPPIPIQYIGRKRDQRVGTDATTLKMRTTKKGVAITGFGTALLFVLVFAIFFYFNFTTVVVSGNSMEPTFQNGERLLASRAYWLVGQIKRRDVVVVRTQGQDPGQTGYIIKRVLGLPGDKIDGANVPDSWRVSDGPFVVPPGRVYVIGDNREVSEDSRRLGAVPLEDVLGKIVIRR